MYCLCRYHLRLNFLFNETNRAADHIYLVYNSNVPTRSIRGKLVSQVPSADDPIVSPALASCSRLSLYRNSVVGRNKSMNVRLLYSYSSNDIVKGQYIHRKHFR